MGTGEIVYSCKTVLEKEVSSSGQAKEDLQNYADESPTMRGNRRSLHFWTWLKTKKPRGI